MRVLTFGSAVGLTVAGALVGVIFGSITGEAFAIALGSLGLIGLVSLAFYEVGLSEDRERARTAAAAPPRGPAPTPRRIPRRPRRPS
jgi:hypothetical protein